MLKITVKGKSPVWGERCMIADNATLAGDITMGNDCSIWFGAVLRADVDKIVMGDRCNVQDLACIHQTAGGAAVLGNDVSLGHGAVVHAATIHDGALIGMNAVVLDHAEVGSSVVQRFLTERYGVAFLRDSSRRLPSDKQRNMLRTISPSKNGIKNDEC